MEGSNYEYKITVSKVLSGYRSVRWGLCLSGGTSGGGSYCILLVESSIGEGGAASKALRDDTGGDRNGGMWGGGAGGTGGGTDGGEGLGGRTWRGTWWESGRRSW